MIIVIITNTVSLLFYHIITIFYLIFFYLYYIYYYILFISYTTYIYYDNNYVNKSIVTMITLMIIQALLRPGRLDRIIYVGLPDEETRREIFNIKLQNMPIAKEENIADKENVDKVNIADLVSLTEGYTGAEIQAICHEAAMKALEENLNATVIVKKHFKAAFKIVTPRTSISLLQIYEDYNKNNNK